MIVIKWGVVKMVLSPYFLWVWWESEYICGGDVMLCKVNYSKIVGIIENNYFKKLQK